MPTKDRILNNALRLLGEPPSTGVDDTSPWVKRLLGAHDDVLQGMLESYPWNFAVKVQQLAADATADKTGWDYAFTKPGLCWRLMGVSDRADWRPGDYEIPYDDQRGFILTNFETTYLMFVDGTFKDREGDWPQVFADYLAAKLAHSVAPVTDEGNSTMERIERALVDRRRAAKAWDAQSKAPWKIPLGRYLTSRHAGIRTPARSGRYGR
ncbi:MAG: hypothetical protein AAFR33_11265 [Pseudomonadota bacterium]